MNGLLSPWSTSVPSRVHGSCSAVGPDQALDQDQGVGPSQDPVPVGDARREGGGGGRAAGSTGGRVHPAASRALSHAAAQAAPLDGANVGSSTAFLSFPFISFTVKSYEKM